MRRFLLFPLAVLALVAIPLRATAQDKTIRGTVSAIAGNSLTVKAGSSDMKFSVDDKTEVTAVGGGTKTRAAVAAGKAGPSIGEILKVGQAVEVTYHDMGGGVMHASHVRQIARVGSGAPTTANGTVAAVSPTSLTINGTAGGGSTFTQTYVIDAKTRVVAHGASTATAETGGKTPVTSLVGKGDKVTVAFDDQNGTLHASEVRVTAKAAK